MESGRKSNRLFSFTPWLQPGDSEPDKEQLTLSYIADAGQVGFDSERTRHLLRVNGLGTLEFVCL